MARKKKQEKLSEDEVYAAVTILEEKHDERNSVMYLVKWAGKDQNGNEWEPTWEPYENCGTPLIREWEENKTRRNNGEFGNQMQNNINTLIANEGKKDYKDGMFGNHERFDNICQLRQINGKKKKPHQLNGTPNATEDGNIVVGRSLSCDNDDRNKDIIVSESSRIPISKRVILRKNSMKNLELDVNRKHNVSLKSRQVNLYRSLSSKGKVFAHSPSLVSDSSCDSSDSEQESLYMNGNSTIQFYKYPLRSRSGRLSITRRLDCSSISKRKVSLRSSDARISEDLDSRKKLRYDEDSYSSEEEILCSGQVFTCSPVTSIITHTKKSDASIDNLQVSPIPKTINSKVVDKPVSNPTPQDIINSPTNVNINGSPELAQKPSNDSNLGSTAANDASSFSKKQPDNHNSIQNSKTGLSTSTNQCVNINVNTQSPESLLSIAPKPGQTARSDANLKTTQKRTQPKTRKLPLKTDAVKSVSQLTVNSSNPPILPKPPTSTNLIPIIRSTSLMNNNANVRSVQNRTIRPNSDLYPNPILPDDNYKVKDGQNSVILADHGQQSRNTLHSTSTAHKSLGVSQANPLGVGVSNLQLENPVVTTNTTNCNTTSNLRNKTNIPSYQESNSASEQRNMNLQLDEQRKTIEKQMEELSKAQRALAEKSEEYEQLKNTMNNMKTDESLRRENESLKQENEMLKMFWAKLIHDGIVFNQKDYDKLSTMCALIQDLYNQNDNVLGQYQKAQSTSTSSTGSVNSSSASFTSSNSHSSVPVISSRNDGDINAWKRNDQLLRSKLNQSQLEVLLLEKSLQMKDENEKMYQRAAKLVIDLKLEPLKSCMELQNNVKALIPPSLISENSRLNTNHNAIRKDTPTSKASNDTILSNTTKSKNINVQTNNTLFNADNNNSSSVKGTETVESVTNTTTDKGSIKTKNNTEVNVFTSTNIVNPKLRETVATTPKTSKTSVTIDKNGPSTFDPVSRKIATKTNVGMPNSASAGPKALVVPSNYTQEEVFCNWDLCNMSFTTKPDLKKHVMYTHFRDHEKELKPYILTLN
ncbi:14542_t:CDS:2, partial [Cetraspora pellucida]